MIIGNGDIALVLQDREDLIYFASGVSNSQETRESEFRREKYLLFEQIDKQKKIIYFGSLSIFYKDSPYTRHKRKMEQYVRIFPEYTIIRLGNIAFGNNPYTIINNFKYRLKKNEPIEVQDTYRFVIDKDEFLFWISMIPDWNCEMNCPGRRMKVSEILKEIKQGKL
jgi:hypothetical protein